MVEKRSRSIAKTLTWRVIASGANAFIVFAFIGDVGLAAGVGALDLLAKSVFYYGHERLWNRITWGRNLKNLNSKKN